MISSKSSIAPLRSPFVSIVNLAFSKRTLCWEEFCRAEAAQTTTAVRPMATAIGIKDFVRFIPALSCLMTLPPSGGFSIHPECSSFRAPWCQRKVKECQRLSSGVLLRFLLGEEILHDPDLIGPPPRGHRKKSELCSIRMNAQPRHKWH